MGFFRVLGHVTKNRLIHRSLSTDANTLIQRLTGYNVKSLSRPDIEALDEVLRHWFIERTGGTLTPAEAAVTRLIALTRLPTTERDRFAKAISILVDQCKTQIRPEIQLVSLDSLRDERSAMPVASVNERTDAIPRMDAEFSDNNQTGGRPPYNFRVAYAMGRSGDRIEDAEELAILQQTIERAMREPPVANEPRTTPYLSAQVQFSDSSAFVHLKISDEGVFAIRRSGCEQRRPPFKFLSYWHYRP